LPLVDACLGPALDKCWALARAGPQSAPAPAALDGGDDGSGGGSGGGGGGGRSAGAEAAHVEGERLALEKQTLVLLSHVATQVRP